MRSRREARLRAEYARKYPYIDVGRWQPAAVLSDAVASMICTTQMTLGVATHTLFIGQVHSIVNHASIDPLIWVDGCFASAQRI